MSARLRDFLRSAYSGHNWADFRRMAGILALLMLFVLGVCLFFASYFVGDRP